MQDDLFGATPPHLHPPERASAKAPARRAGIQPVVWDEALHALARRLPPQLRLGTSSWSYPGWQGLVWEGAHSEPTLAKKGLPVYAQHPLLRTVSIDRSFYRPLGASDYLRYAEQVPADFRFVVKAPSLVTDALVRSEDGQGRAPNPAFLDPLLAAQEFVAPALAGLGARTGALVFQLSPLPWQQLERLPTVLERLRAMLQAQPPLTAPDAVLAVEVRDPAWLAPEHLPHFADVLRESGATYCLGLHARMPPLQAQLPLLRLLWPGPLVCRWNLHRRHGAFGYEAAKAQYEPFDQLIDPDDETRTHLARVIAGTCGAGELAYVTINNKAEGSAPLSVAALAEAVTNDAPGQGDS